MEEEDINDDEGQTQRSFSLKTCQASIGTDTMKKKDENDLLFF